MVEFSGALIGPCHTTLPEHKLSHVPIRIYQIDRLPHIKIRCRITHISHPPIFQNATFKNSTHSACRNQGGFFLVNFGWPLYIPCTRPRQTPFTIPDQYIHSKPPHQILYRTRNLLFLLKPHIFACSFIFLFSNQPVHSGYKTLPVSCQNEEPGLLLLAVHSLYVLPTWITLLRFIPFWTFTPHHHPRHSWLLRVQFSSSLSWATIPKEWFPSVNHIV